MVEQRYQRRTGVHLGNVSQLNHGPSSRGDEVRSSTGVRTLRQDTKRTRLRLSQVRALTMYAPDKGAMSAKAFVHQLERKFSVVGISPQHYLDIAPFILQESAWSRYQSNIKRKFWYGGFRTLFLWHYHSDGVTRTQLTCLRAAPFNPRVYDSVVKFVTIR